MHETNAARAPTMNKASFSSTADALGREMNVFHRVDHFGIDSGVHRQPEYKQLCRWRLPSFTTPNP
jgi:hypothetical protein